MSKRNILLIYADQWRHDQFGSPKSYLPNLEALAAEAVSFTRHYTQVIPCSPARASLFTGLYAQTHGVFQNRVPLDARHKTLAQYLRQSGYAPTLFGYTDTALDPRTLEPGDPRAVPGYDILPGCDVGCHMPSDAPHDWLAHLRSKGLSFESIDDVYAPDTSKPNAAGGAGGHPARYQAEDSDTAYLTDRLLGWQREQEPGWCALLCYLRPHRPTIAPEPYNSLVDPMSLQPPVRAANPDEEGAIHPFMAHQMEDGQAGEKTIEGLEGRVADMDERDWRSIRAIHLALMAELDAHLGRIFDQLKATGQWDDTLILFSSDHGEMMFDHHLCSQASWHEACAHVPLILRDPAPEARTQDGTEVSAFSEAVDTIPTLLDWLGRPPPAYLDGASVVPFLRGEPPTDWRDHVVWEYQFRDMQDAAFAKENGLDARDCMMSVYRDERYKHVAMPGLPSLLFDMQADPHEFRNLAAEGDCADIERAYMDRQLRHRIRHVDRVLAPTHLI
ncbi:MAG: sulfatase-like hydrolase/transferase [Pseudomonadota bacterium]